MINNEPRKNKKNIVLFLSMLIYPFFPLIKEWSPFGGMLIEATLIVLLFLDSIIVFRNGKANISLSKISAYYFVFLSIYLIINISNITAAFSGFRSLAFYVILLNSMDKDEYEQKNKVEVAAKAIIIACVIISLGAIIQFVSPLTIRQFHEPKSADILRWKTDWTPFSIYNRALSFMTDPNVLSVFLIASYILVINYYKNKKNSVLKTVILILLVIALLLTQSRTGIFLFLIYYLSLWILDLFRKNRISFAKVVLAFGVIIAAVAILWTKLDSVLSFLRIETILNGNGRTLKNQIHQELLFSDPLRLFFGHGLFDGRLIIFENSYLMLLYMFGIFGSILFCILLARTFKGLVSRFSLEVMLCYLAANLVGDYILIPQISTVFLVALCMYRENRQAEMLSVV